MQFITHPSCKGMSVSSNQIDSASSTHLLGRKSLASEIIAARREAFLDNIRVHFEEILHLAIALVLEPHKKPDRRTCFFSIILFICCCSAALKFEKSMAVEVNGEGEHGSR